MTGTLEIVCGDLGEGTRAVALLTEVDDNLSIGIMPGRTVVNSDRGWSDWPGERLRPTVLHSHSAPSWFIRPLQGKPSDVVFNRYPKTCFGWQGGSKVETTLPTVTWRISNSWLLSSASIKPNIAHRTRTLDTLMLTLGDL